MMLKRTSWVVAAFALAAGSAMAQSSEVKTETKVEVKDGKDVKLTGCVERLPEAGASARYRLTNVADTAGRRHSYLLVGKDGELDRHVGHMVEVKGKAADREDGKVKVKNKAMVKDGQGRMIAMGRTMSLVIVDQSGKELATHKIPYGARLHVDEGDEVKRGTRLAQWDPYTRPILTEATGKVEFEDLIEGA